MYSVPNTITSAITICGILSDTSSIIFDGSNAYERTANNISDYDSNTCIDLNFSDI